ncbi:lipoteichoic acid stability factor AuxA [Macrococcus armenti]|uniref:lipoteichoic acid stability factor AuxA n=1 Tax=Macrococcus armenti TaxID=2875764 RepID=UPI001CCEF6AB|nr:hypothetical protein [Macrococcus armenti]UBH13890.1 hypothetical protein LAU43_04130 [Macrococcus armenti]
MNWIKKHFEILIGYILAVMHITLGIFVIVNYKQIARFEDVNINKMHMYSFFDFINIYAFELIKLLSHYIHQFTLLFGVLFIVIGFAFFYVSRKLKATTLFDRTIAQFYLLFSSLLYIVTSILIFEMYGFFALLYLFLFVSVVYYTLNRKRLNDNFRKLHLNVLIFIYALAYFLTQLAVYDNLDKRKVTPLDVMTINFFFIILTVLATLCLVNYVFLKRTLMKPNTEMKRTEKRRDSKVSRLLRENTNMTINKLSEESLKLDEKIVYFLKKFSLSNLIKLNEDDIPSWFRLPKWLRIFHIEMVLSSLLFLITAIELNNRNILFSATKFNVVKMQYFYEWINLFGLLVIIILYIYFTIMIFYKSKGYIGQLFTISFLLIKVLVSFYLMIFKGINLSLFIPPILILLILIILPLYVFHIRRKY